MENITEKQCKRCKQFKSLEYLDNNSEIKNFLNKAKKFWEKIN